MVCSQAVSEVDDFIRLFDLSYSEFQSEEKKDRKEKVERRQNEVRGKRMQERINDKERKRYGEREKMIV